MYLYSVRAVYFFFCAIIACCIYSCRQHPANTLFIKKDASHTGINFNNVVQENDSVNPLDLEFLYNGGGVATGDFDNNGLPDLYFTASTTSNKLYLNQGNFSFKDVTEEAKVTGEGRWANAASIVDINNDGWKDIYVCATLKNSPNERRNILYINQGLNANKVPVFKEMAAEYNLADSGYSVHAAFFDYDNDGDLDLYLLQTKLAGRNAVQFSSNNLIDESKTDVDKLFRNDWSDSLKHPVFTDVSKQANILEGGFGLGVSIADINRDGWKDIYVTNDFYTNDLLYINNHDGTFTNKAKEYFKHFSQNAMGNDIADVNNDGFADVIAVDMNPEDNFRKKKNMGGNNYNIYQNMMYGGYNLQYVRNTLQLNQGPRMNRNDSIGDPVFSEIGWYAGVAETDWSWNANIVDLDNDGLRDIVITNGYPRDVTDHDFAAFRKTTPKATKKELIDQIPQIRIPNYAFKNNGSLKFKNVTTEWGLDQPSFSNGAIYVDLDNDGDLDYVINDINENALVYENTVNNKEHLSGNYLQIKFDGEKNNLNGLGAIATIYYNKTMQVYENSPYRGYLSTVNDVACFGLGKITAVDSLVILWPGGKKQVLQNVKANQLIHVDAKDATDSATNIPLVAKNNLLTDVTSDLGISYRHDESDVVDFDKERLLPHKLSQYGPGISVADINGDGLDDMILGGNTVMEPTFLIQQKDGKFTSSKLPTPQGQDVRRLENMGIVFFDVDNDGDEDLYLTAGSNEFYVNTKNYQDRLYINDGKANFTLTVNSIPQNFTSKSCVKAADYDGDGDLDLFIGGRVLPGSYPMPVSSFIYRNDSKDTAIKFTDVTKQVAAPLVNIGMICDALWTDFDNDGVVDLILAGEWMPIRFFKNDHGTLKDVSSSSGTNTQSGWWNSIAGADIDNDGDIDYIVGNLGENSFYRASEQYPINIYAKDYDKNGSIDAITTLYLKDRKNRPQKFTAQNRDDINTQLPGLKKRFLTYKDFGTATFEELFTDEDRKGAMNLTANYLKSSVLINQGNGKFQIRALPEQAQIAPIYGIIAEDFNNDGNLDLALAGNDYGTEVSTGRYDALNGLLLLGNGKGNFQPETIRQSGLYIPGDAKAFVKLRNEKGNVLLAASQNRSMLKVFRQKQSVSAVPVKSDDRFAIIYLKNGQKRKEEFYYGNSFLSQSSRFVTMNDTIEKVEMNNGKANRTINNQKKNTTGK